MNSELLFEIAESLEKDSEFKQEKECTFPATRHPNDVSGCLLCISRGWVWRWWRRSGSDGSGTTYRGAPIIIIILDDESRERIVSATLSIVLPLHLSSVPAKSNTQKIPRRQRAAAAATTENIHFFSVQNTFFFLSARRQKSCNQPQRALQQNRVRSCNQI